MRIVVNGWSMVCWCIFAGGWTKCNKDTCAVSFELAKGSLEPITDAYQLKLCNKYKQSRLRYVLFALCHYTMSLHYVIALCHLTIFLHYVITLLSHRTILSSLYNVIPFLFLCTRSTRISVEGFCRHPPTVATITNKNYNSHDMHRLKLG